ncbi:MAG: hypothetical protein LBL31_05275 [Spirochaetaceae bacterium]|jgi:hypothetical protein|nr:hypothetical protein [Spirochaetaceae bacterium]
MTRVAGNLARVAGNLARVAGNLARVAGNLTRVAGNLTRVADNGICGQRRVIWAWFGIEGELRTGKAESFS